MKILITGASSGIGMALAQRLNHEGHYIYLSGRNAKQLHHVQSLMRPNSSQVLVADLSSMKQVWKLAEQVYASTDTLDCLVNNAGIIALKREDSEDGFELTFAVNYLAPFLLSNLLAPILQKGSSGQIINVSSIAHYFGSLYQDDLQLQKSYSVFKSYAQSKLASVIFTVEMANRFESDKLRINALHPGIVNTQLGSKHSTGMTSWIWDTYTKRFGISPSAGAENSHWLITSEKALSYSGSYFHQLSPKKPSSKVNNIGLRNWLWKESMQLCGLPEY
jgi:retinol dehydrogenase-14